MSDLAGERACENYLNYGCVLLSAAARSFERPSHVSFAVRSPFVKILHASKLTRGVWNL